MADHTERLNRYATEQGLTETQWTTVLEATCDDVRWQRKILNAGKAAQAERMIEKIAAAAQPKAVELTDGGATEAQVDYLKALGATDEQIIACNKTSASQLITRLKDSPAAQAKAFGRSVGVNGEVWDNA